MPTPNTDAELQSSLALEREWRDRAAAKLHNQSLADDIAEIYRRLTDKLLQARRWSVDRKETAN